MGTRMGSGKYFLLLAPDLRIPARQPGDDTPRLLLKKLVYRLEGKRIYQ